jgi:hypothetical protein
MIPALVLTHRAVECRMADQAERQCPKQRQEERLPGTGEEKQRVHPCGVRWHERQEAVAETEHHGRPGQRCPPRSDPIGDQAGWRLHEEDAKARQRDSKTERRLRPLPFFQIIAKERHHDAGDLGKKEVRSVEGRPALERNGRLVQLAVRLPGHGCNGAHE